MPFTHKNRLDKKMSIGRARQELIRHCWQGQVPTLQARAATCDTHNGSNRTLANPFAVVTINAKRKSQEQQPKTDMRLSLQKMVLFKAQLFFFEPGTCRGPNQPTPQE
jgi:hypothetical protein